LKNQINSLTTLTQGLEKVAEYRDGTIYRLNTQ